MSPTWWIGPIAAAAALPFVFAVLRALFPAKRSLAQIAEQDRKVFDRWIRVGVVLWLLLTPVAGYFCWDWLCSWGAQIRDELPDGRYTSLPDGVTWALPAALFGMLASAVTVDAALRLFSPRRYRDFVHYQETRLGFSESATLPLLAVLCVGGALFVAAIGDWYVIVTPDETIVDGFFGASEERYQHADVNEIRTAPYLKAPLGGRARRISAIRYQDGRSWVIDTMPGPISDDEILEITHYVARQSGVEAQEVPSISREFF